MSAPAFYPAPDGRWLALRDEPVIDPAQPIVDAHHHLLAWPGWRYGTEELMADLGAGHAVHSTVYLQCGEWYRQDGPKPLRPVGETEYVEAQARRLEAQSGGALRPCAAIVGFANLLLGDAVDEVLEAHRAASPARFRGIRHGAASDPHPAFAAQGYRPPLELFAQPAFRAGMARLAAHGLLFEAWVYQTQLDDVLHLARAFPDMTIVLDHAGGPLGIGPYEGCRSDTFAAWRAAMQSLAACHKVVVKLGGLAMRQCGFGFHEAALPPDSQQLAAAWQPYVETCIELFGAARCMFESNFPVDQGSCSYRVLWNAFKRLAASCSPDERAALFEQTALRTYRISAPAAR